MIGKLLIGYVIAGVIFWFVTVLAMCYAIKVQAYITFNDKDTEEKVNIMRAMSSKVLSKTFAKFTVSMIFLWPRRLIELLLYVNKGLKNIK